jgi:hypothetical protein
MRARLRTTDEPVRFIHEALTGFRKATGSGELVEHGDGTGRVRFFPD